MINSIQYLRAIAALMVIMHHIAWKGMTYSINPLAWFHVGEAGVDLFFIISGYIICVAVEGKQCTIKQFLIARIKRIIPLYWFLTTLALFVYIVYPNKVNSSGGVTDIISSYLLIPTEGKYLIQNGWTLSYEFLFYLVFSISLCVRVNLRYVFLFGIMLAPVIFGVFLPINKPIFILITNPMVIEFIIGVLIYLINKKINPSGEVKRLYGMLLILVSSLIFIFSNNYVGELNRVIRFLPPCASLFFGLILLEGLFKRIRNNHFLKGLSYLGSASYSMYLSHPFSLAISSIVLDKYGLTDNGFIFVMLLFGFSIFVGCLCYKLLEQPLTKAIKRIDINSSLTIN